VASGARVRVGIVSWNTAPLLERCLAALPAALGDLDADVVVVDNASHDGSAAVAARHGVTVIANAENVGYARAMNQALAAGERADVLVALNPDTEPPPGSLARLADRLAADTTVGVAVPRLAEPEGREQHSVYRFPSPLVTLVVSFCPATLLRLGVGRRFWLEGWSDHRRRVDVDWAIGAVHAVRTDALDGSAPYDERWFMYAEDLELCWRLHRAGWRVRLEGDIAVPHVGNASGAQAWGDQRTVRWLVPTYQWYEQARGPAAARRWAAVNAACLRWLRLKWRALARLSPGRYGHFAAWAADAVAPLAVHREVRRRGVQAVARLAGGPPVAPADRQAEAGQDTG
jgi:GT2 family glycosyltransferase